MKEIITKARAKGKRAVVLGSLFLNIFAAIFYITNLYITPSEARGDETAVKKEANKEAADENLKKKISATGISFSGYEEWTKKFHFEDDKKDVDNDPDGDKMPNYLEYVYGTNPVKADSDGDSYDDKSEIAHGYDPTESVGDPRPELSVVIGKISLQAPVIWSNSENENEMMGDLQNGVIHYYNTAAPGQNGNMIISGHSSNYVWAKGNYNHIFKDLDRLERDDIVIVRSAQKNGKIISYRYKITDKRVTTAEDQTVFENTPGPTLTLVTCWPLGTNLKRLVVRAVLVK